MKKFIQIIFTIFYILFTPISWAAISEYRIEIKNHRFNPEIVKVPVGKKIKLIIDNLDPSVEEFESHDLKREKIVAGGKKISIFVGPLKKGEYKFFGEFHEDTAQGILVAE